jgi:D-xylose transport system substrate-binding protein
MRKTFLAASLAVVAFSTAAFSEGKKIGVSWSNFQEPRWKFDAAAMRSAIQRDGNKYITTDAQGSTEKQMADIRQMIEDGVDSLVILPMDREAILPALDMAEEAGIPVISYDRLIEDERVFYITFDNVGVGRIIAATVRTAQPEGNYVIIKGDPGDANSDFLRKGMEEVIGAAVAGGTIKIVGEAYTDGWKPDVALTTMEQFLRDNGNKIDAVLAENDGIAGAAADALAAQGMTIPIGGQDGDPKALNRVARGTQTVSVWKNNLELGKATGHIAGMLAEGTPMDRIPEVVKFSDGEKGAVMNAILLTPTAITKDTLHLVIEADVISQRDACAGAQPGVSGCE